MVAMVVMDFLGLDRHFSASGLITRIICKFALQVTLQLRYLDSYTEQQHTDYRLHTEIAAP